MKVALVTGAYKGLGFAWCEELAKIGYHVVLTARDLEKAKSSAAVINEQFLVAYPLALDTTDEESIKSAAAWVEVKFGKLDLLVNNAGINSGTRAKGDKELQVKNLSLYQLDKSEVLNMIDINAIAPIIVARNFAQLLAKSDAGKIVNIGSWLGSITNKNSGGNYSYAVSKSALNMMNRALAFDLIGSGITSVVVNPGWVSTDMGGSRAQFTPSESVKNLIKNVVDKISPQDAGKFFNYDGTVHPW
jgi:NAD(P)-dependent dehydrogenase (short-subunit alcohol dehydrogenase family)